MENKEKQRTHLSALQKRKALIEITKGVKPQQILEKTSSDKKYANKLIHKWKKEHFAKNHDLFKNLCEIDMNEIDIKYEMQTFSFNEDDEIDFFDFENM